MKKTVFFLLVSLFIFSSSCETLETNQEFSDQKLIREKLDSIQRITEPYDADSVYDKLKYVSQRYPQEFLEVNLQTLEAFMRNSRKTQKWENLEEVQRVMREAKEIEMGIKSAKSQEEVQQLNEKFDSLHEEFQRLEKKYPHLHNYN